MQFSYGHTTILVLPGRNGAMSEPGIACFNNTNTINLLNFEDFDYWS